MTDQITIGINKRSIKDRRNKSGFNIRPFLYGGRREKIRRREDTRRIFYVDHYSSGLFAIIVSIWMPPTSTLFQTSKSGSSFLQAAEKSCLAFANRLDSCQGKAENMIGQSSDRIRAKRLTQHVFYIVAPGGPKRPALIDNAHLAE